MSDRADSYSCRKRAKCNASIRVDKVTLSYLHYGIGQTWPGLAGIRLPVAAPVLDGGDHVRQLGRLGAELAVKEGERGVGRRSGDSGAGSRRGG